MNILVTGGTGHLGAWLVVELAKKGHIVTVICRNPAQVQYLNITGVHLVKGDILNPDSLTQAMQGIDQVYHLAAFAEVWAKDKSIYHQINIEGTRNVLNAAKDAGVKKIVATSSAGNFGPSIEGIITEQSVRTEPFYTLYEETKHSADLLTLDYVQSGMDIVLVYPTRVYGPVLSGKPASITLLLSKIRDEGFRIIPGNGAKIGNYVYVDDVTRGFILAMEHGKAGEKYILGGENHALTAVYQEAFKCLGLMKKPIFVPLSILKVIVLAQKMGTWFGKKPTLTQDWLKKILLDWNVSSDKAQSELGYTITPLQLGIKNTLDSFENAQINS